MSDVTLDLLDPCASVRAWLARVEALDGFVPMPRSGVAAS